MAKQKSKGDVYYWHPDGKHKRPIAYSTRATSDLLGILSQECNTHNQLLQMINYDEDAKVIVQKYIDLGYGDKKPLFKY